MEKDSAASTTMRKVRSPYKPMPLLRSSQSVASMSSAQLLGDGLRRWELKHSGTSYSTGDLQVVERAQCDLKGRDVQSLGKTAVDVYHAVFSIASAEEIRRISMRDSAPSWHKQREVDTVPYDGFAEGDRQVKLFLGLMAISVYESGIIEIKIDPVRSEADVQHASRLARRALNRLIGVKESEAQEGGSAIYHQISALQAKNGEAALSSAERAKIIIARIARNDTQNVRSIRTVISYLAHHGLMPESLMGPDTKASLMSYGLICRHIAKDGIAQPGTAQNSRCELTKLGRKVARAMEGKEPAKQE